MNRREVRNTVCFFCKEGKEPCLTEAETLGKFSSERGRILPRLRTGLCSKHQKMLTKEIKRARYLALLPFIVKPD